MVEKNLRGIFLYRGNFFCFLYTTLACTHFCRLGTFGFLTTPRPTKYKRTGKHCSFTDITIIPYYTAKCQQLCKGESNTNSPSQFLSIIMLYLHPPRYHLTLLRFHCHCLHYLAEIRRRFVTF